jgi:di/tricarboxylate transporter
MGWDAWFTAVVIIAMLAVLARGRYGTDIVMLLTVTVFVVSGIVSPTDAFKGFSNTGLVTVAFLYVVATGLQETGGMSLVTSRLLGRPKTIFAAQARLIPPVVGLSAFMNNTPLVAMFIPVLRELSRITRIPAAYLLMPLSFAAILGGVCTLIGTSTNLVVYSLIEGYNKDHKDAPLEQMGMWTITWVGVPVAIAGIAYMLLLGRKLIPVRDTAESGGGEAREYTASMRVPAGSPLSGKTIEAAGLRHLPGLFLSRIERETESIVAVGPEVEMRENDHLIFVGQIDSIVDLQKIKGLAPLDGEGDSGRYRPKMRLVEAVVSSSSPLVGRSIREAGIRTRYGAVVVAVHRLGHRLTGKIGDIEIRPGDTLLLETDMTFLRRHRRSTDFYLVSELEGTATLRHERGWVALAILLGLIVMLSVGELPYIGKVPEVVSAMVAAAAMILTRCCTGPQARAGMEWPVLIVIGASFGLGKAMENTGLALTIAQNLSAFAAPYGPWALIGVVYVLTLGFTTLINNNAAAALMFPIVLPIAQAGGYHFMPFAVTIALAASLEFMTPLGYQTNLMVMRPGAYRFFDFTRFGGPLTVLCALVAIGVLPIVFPLK